MPGRPDLVLPKYSAVCLVHGCYWHRHPGCRYATTPTTRPDFWKEKFRSNVERDERQRRQLRDMGWRIAVVWECALTRKTAATAVSRLIPWLLDDVPTLEIGHIDPAEVPQVDDLRVRPSASPMQHDLTIAK